MVQSLRRAYEDRRNAPDVSLHLLRQAAEGVCYITLLAKNRIGTEKRGELGDLIQRASPFLRDDERALHALREWGNRTSHAQGRPEKASPEEAAAMFLLTAQPLRWLYSEILKEPVPGDLEERYAAVVQATRVPPPLDPQRKTEPTEPTPTARSSRAASAWILGIGTVLLGTIAILLMARYAPRADDVRPSSEPTTNLSAATSAPGQQLKPASPAHDADGRAKELAAALNSRDRSRVVALYSEPTVVFGTQYRSRADVAQSLKSWWAKYPDEMVQFESCSNQAASASGLVAVCTGVVTRQGRSTAFKECLTWSDDGLIQRREDARSSVECAQHLR